MSALFPNLWIYRRPRHLRRVLAWSMVSLCVFVSAASAQQCAPPLSGRSCGDAPSNCPYVGSRIALVMGNNKYMGLDHQKLPDLQNAVRDAQEVANTLHAMGFRVHCVTDALRAEAEKEFELVRSYNEILDKDVADGRLRARDIQLVVYFAGHGLRNVTKNQNMMIFRHEQGSINDSTLVAISHPVGTMVKRYLVSAHVQPVVLIDACRASAIVAQPGEGSPGPGLKSYAVYYSVSSGGVAPDAGAERFTPFMTKQLQLRGLPLHLMFSNVAARLKEKLKPLPEGEVPIATPALTHVPWRRPSEACDLEALDVWHRIAYLCSDGINEACLRSFDPKQEPSVCNSWRDWNSRCPNNPLTKEFARYFERDERKPCDDPQVVAELGARPPVVQFAGGEVFASLAAKRFAVPGLPTARFVARGAAPKVAPVNLETLAPRMLRSQKILTLFRTAEFSEPLLAQDRLEVVNPVALHPLPTLRTQLTLGITLEKGTQVLRDCETLQCQPDWVGVQYKDPKKNQTYRGFLPTSAVFVTLPNEVPLDYVENELVPDAASLERLDKSIANFPAIERGLIRPQVSARYLAGSDAEGRVLARVRASTLSAILRSAGFKPATTDVYEAADTTIPAAVAELPIR
jgi:hypothetical protein